MKIPQLVDRLKITFQDEVHRAQYLSGIIMDRLQRAELVEVPHYTRFGLYSQALIIVVCLIWFRWSWPILPTVALGILSVVAVIMTVRADRFSHGERVIYVLIASALLMVEMTAIYAERDRHDKEQGDLRTRESEARKKESEEFAALIQNGNKLFENQEQMFAEITGVGSYLFMMPTAPISLGGKTFEVTLLPQLIGKHPHRVNVSRNAAR